MTVNNIPASCGLGPSQSAVQVSNSTICAFHYSTDFRPTVSAITPLSGKVNDILTIMGNGFSPDFEQNEVFLGSTPCLITEAQTSQLKCRVGLSLAGPQPVSVRVPSKGWSNATGNGNLAIVFDYQLTVSAISPDTGSLAGGTDVTITGDGFLVYNSSKPQETGTMLVNLGNQSCAVRWSNRSVILCMTTNSSASLVNVIVSVNTSKAGGVYNQQTGQLVGGYTYSPQSSPTLLSVFPVSGSGGGGTTLTLHGTLFPSDAASVKVKVTYSLHAC